MTNRRLVDDWVVPLYGKHRDKPGQVVEVTPNVAGKSPSWAHNYIRIRFLDGKFNTYREDKVRRALLHELPQLKRRT